MEDVLALVGHARPHLVDPWDALAVLESSGYTDARVNRELGLADTRELAERVFAQLSERPLPPSPAAGASAQAHQDAPRVRTTALLALGWSVMLVAVAVILRVPISILPLALLPSVIVSCGFVEAMRRRGAFYAAIGQPRLGRITCWYFMRLAALLTAAVTAAGVALGWLSGAGWPQLALWADTFAIGSALWLLAGAMQVPGMFSRSSGEAAVPMPRMTIVAFRELRLLAASAAYAVAFGLVVIIALNYAMPRLASSQAAVVIVGGAAGSFVLSTIAARLSTRTHPVSFS